MKHFGTESLDFLRRLARNNAKTWFEDHRGDYEQYVKQPMSDLVEEMDLDLVTSRVTSRQILIEPQGGHRVHKEFRMRAYTCAELTALLARHRFEVDGVWGGAERETATPRPGQSIELAYAVEANCWQGRTRLQLVVEDLKVQG